MKKLLIMLFALAVIGVSSSDASAGVFRRHRVRVVHAPVYYSHAHYYPRHYVVPYAPVYHHGFYRGHYGGGYGGGYYGGGGIYIRAPFVRIGIGF